jgi:hypothetical protein
MTNRGRGSTGLARPSPLPPDGYEAPAPVREGASGGLIVEFHGDDNRRASYDIGELPMHGWHALCRGLAPRAAGPPHGSCFPTGRPGTPVIAAQLTVISRSPASVT